MLLKLIEFEKLSFFGIYSSLLCLSCFFKTKFLQELQSSNFWKKIKDFYKKLLNRIFLMFRNKKIYLKVRI